MRKATLSKLRTEGKIGERINILNSIIMLDLYELLKYFEKIEIRLLGTKKEIY